MVAAQGGDPDAPLAVAPDIEVVRAPRAGYVTKLDARAVGIAAWRLGAGRARKEDPVAESAGVVCLHEPGDRVDAGAPVLELHIDDPTKLPAALDALGDAITITDNPPTPPPLVLRRIGPA
jgi:thymidine phosphorylase